MLDEVEGFLAPHDSVSCEAAATYFRPQNTVTVIDEHPGLKQQLTYLNEQKKQNGTAVGSQQALLHAWRCGMCW